MLDRMVLFFTILGGLNWGSVGLFNVDVIAWIFGAGSILTRVFYTLIALSAVWCISLFFKNRGDILEHNE